MWNEYYHYCRCRCRCHCYYRHVHCYCCSGCKRLYSMIWESTLYFGLYIMMIPITFHGILKHDTSNFIYVYHNSNTIIGASVPVARCGVWFHNDNMLIYWEQSLRWWCFQQRPRSPKLTTWFHLCPHNKWLINLCLLYQSGWSRPWFEKFPAERLSDTFQGMTL